MFSEQPAAAAVFGSFKERILRGFLLKKKGGDKG
jgi:hypothetical protein